MTLIYICTSVVLLCAYLTLIVFIYFQWNKQDTYISSFKLSNNKYKFAILIPARNEEHNIINCLRSLRQNDALSQLNLEVIVIDDCSEDTTAQLVEFMEWDLVKLLRLSSEDKERPKYAHKKWALFKALELTSADYIIQLDADCVVESDYLRTVVSFVNEREPHFVAAPVKFDFKRTAFQSFQALDLMGMMAFTQAGINTKSWYMANGANMVYKKDTFTHKHDGLASGDDVYAIQEVAENNPADIYYLKGAIVSTQPVLNFEEFYQQRIRWATKNKHMKSMRFLFVMAIPYIFSVSFFLHLVLIPILGSPALSLLIISLFSKALFDFIYLKELSHFFKTENALKHYVIAQLYHLLYIVGIGTLSLFIKKYTWKERRVK